MKPPRSTTGSPPAGDLFCPSDLAPPGPGHIETWAAQHDLVPFVGVDEAGRGCLAGPVVAAAVVLPEGFDATGIDDSKALSAETRDRLAERIRATAFVGVGMGDADRIDGTDILAATLEAMKAAVEEVLAAFGRPVRLVVVDGNQPIRGLSLPQRPWPKGDALSVAVGAASIVAKTTRDRLMEGMDALYPGYGFARHKGYGTPEHLAALQALGPCPIHRRTFAPVAALLGADGGQKASSSTTMDGSAPRQATVATKKRTSS